MKFSADYRALALDALRGRWKTAVLTGLVASVLGANIVSSSDRVISNMSQNANGDTPGFAGLFSTGSGGVLAVLVVCILAWAVFTFIVSGAARLGYARFNLNLADGRDAALSDLASQKHRLWDGFCMNFLQGLYVALWSLLLFIPGVVKAYSYAMTPYIMAEHPGLTANEAITESRRIMDGNKWRLFCLDLSFLGWELLCTPTRKRPGRSFTGISPLHLLTPRKSENETYRLLSPARTVRVLRALPPVPAPVPGAPGIFL